MDLIEHRDKAISRLATQFRQSVNLINYIRALLQEADDLETVFQSLLNDRWIDTAEGVNLDIIGVIVGQPRGLIDAEAFDYWGFTPNPIAGSFGDYYDSTVGSRFRSFGEPIVGERILSDDEYRFYIRARIARNYTKSTIQDIVDQVKLVFDVDLVIISEGNTSYSISLSKILSPSEKYLLEDMIIPKTAGVGVGFQSQFLENFFAFEGIPGGLGFNDGEFAELI